MIFLHDLCIRVVVWVNRLTFPFNGVDVSFGVVHGSALCDARYLVPLNEGQHGLMAHVILLFQLCYSVVVTQVNLRNKLSKMYINKGTVKEAIPTLIHLRDIEFLNSGHNGLL